MAHRVETAKNQQQHDVSRSGCLLECWRVVTSAIDILWVWGTRPKTIMAMYLDRHTHIHTYIHKHIHTYIITYIITYIHTYLRTYIHTYIHTQTYIHTICVCVGVRVRMRLRWRLSSAHTRARHVFVRLMHLHVVRVHAEGRTHFDLLETARVAVPLMKKASATRKPKISAICSAQSGESRPATLPRHPAAKDLRQDSQPPHNQKRQNLKPRKAGPW